MRIARAGVQRAQGQQYQARSQRLPQLRDRPLTRALWRRSSPSLKRRHPIRPRLCRHRLRATNIFGGPTAPRTLVSPASRTRLAARSAEILSRRSAASASARRTSTTLAFRSRRACLRADASRRRTLSLTLDAARLKSSQLRNARRSGPTHPGLLRCRSRRSPGGARRIFRGTNR